MCDFSPKFFQQQRGLCHKREVLGVYLHLIKMQIHEFLFRKKDNLLLSPTKSH